MPNHTINRYRPRPSEQQRTANPGVEEWKQIEAGTPEPAHRGYPGNHDPTRTRASNGGDFVAVSKSTYR